MILHHINVFLSQKLAKIRDFVEEHVTDAQRRQKESYDSNVTPCRRFAPGDAVWLSVNLAGVAGKLKSRWEGGWKVVEISPVTCALYIRMEGGAWST